MRLTLKVVNTELAKRGVRLEKASGYFYFMGGEAANWLHRTVTTEKITDLTLEQWLGEFQRLKRLNAEIAKGFGGKSSAAKRPTKKSAR